MGKIIDFGELERPIREIESVMEKYNQEEKALILKIINGRFNKICQQQKSDEQAQAMFQKFLPKGLLGRLGKDKDEDV